MATRSTPTVLAIGGGGLSEAGELLDRHLIDLTERDSPRVCLIPTGGEDAADQIARFYDVYGGRAEPSHLTLGSVAHSPDLVRRHLLAQDAIYAGGGGMIDVLSRWRAHGVDGVLREAWRAGIVMAGQSAGSLCWFEAGITAVGGQPRPVRGLGLLPASNSVHWSAESRRRRTFIDCVADGMPAGWGIDDGAALVFEGTELSAAVASQPGARAWHVERVGDEVSETPVTAKLLGGGPVASPPPSKDLTDPSNPAIRELRSVRFHQRRGAFGVRRVRLGD
jgi:peptidase E